jgi:transporter family-2 protein
VTWIAFLFALVAGALITVQAGSNAELRQSLGHPMPALAVNYLLGLASVVMVTAAMRVRIPPVEQLSQVPWWAWIGGLVGTAYGVAVVVLAHRMGAAPLMGTVVTGQLLCSVLLDHMGWLGFEQHPAGTGRIIGCALMIAGFTLIAKF